MTVETLRAAIRDVPDFPKPGIIFKDITPILADPVLFKLAVDTLADRHANSRIDKVCAVEARGFIFAAAVAYKLGAGLVPIRKKGKLLFRTYEETYDLEDGTATIAIHRDAFRKGERVALVDDLLATGGTAAAAARLIRKAGGKVVEVDFLVELAFLKGRGKLRGQRVDAPIVY